MLRIATKTLAAEISPQGAELQSLRFEGEDLLWNGDDAWWTGRAPLLFPIVGGLKRDRYTHEGADYSLPKHGFARRSTFEVVSHGPQRCHLRLAASAATRAQFPFEFQLDISFAIARDTLAMTAEVGNRGEAPMPVAFGYHPAFLWPLPGGARAQHRIVFDKDEPAPISRIDSTGLLAREEPTPVRGRELALEDGLFDDDALIFRQPASQSLTYGAPGAPELHIRWENLPHLGIWTKPGGAPFLCIEPWQGYASPAGFSGPLSEKPGSILVAPGESRRFCMDVTVR